MKNVFLTRLMMGLAIASLGLSVSACNTTKATFDSIVRFSSSTSPQELFTVDGLVKDSQKLNLYTAVVHENLQQDMARGGGEYLTSLAVLMKVPQGQESEFSLLSQKAYPVLFSSDQTTPTNTMAVLTREWGANSLVTKRAE